jgi:predicted Fe-Mo cluster-binding NifX family protein
MKFAIPLAEGKLCAHFGHCECFALIDTDEKNEKILSRVDAVPPPHEPGVLPRWLSELKVNVIIAGGMGQKAQLLFNENSIKVIIGASSESPENLVQEFINGTLVSGSNICDH